MNANLKPIHVKALKGNFFSMLDNDWMLVTAGNTSNFNTMTASWGALGILWNKPIAICFIRPQRYTFEFVNNNDYYTLSFFEKKHHNILEFCGSHSGRNTDKVAQTGLTPLTTDKGNISFSQASLILECKKIYSDDIKADNFFDKNLIKSIYPSSDFHRFFIGEISNCYASEQFILEKGIHFDTTPEDEITNF
jgi:flavin reductase (DIM6/NTAB) family NADH-FMN oxidoreductase RutF